MPEKINISKAGRAAIRLGFTIAGKGDLAEPVIILLETGLWKVAALLGQKRFREAYDALPEELRVGFENYVLWKLGKK